MKCSWHRPAVRGPAQFVIITEDPVEAQFELGDAGLLLLAGQFFLQLLLAVFHQIQQAVQLGVVAGPEQAAVRDDHRRAVHQRAAQQMRAVRQIVPALEQIIDDAGRVFPVLLPGQRICPVQRLRQGRQHGRQGRQAVAEGDEVPRVARLTVTRVDRRSRS